jgi:pyrimidine-nucleoside phosphorylase
VADAAGFVARVDAEAVGRAAVLLGAGRERVEDSIDLAAGVMVLKKAGDRVAAGDALAELHYDDDGRLDAALAAAQSAFKLAAAAPAPLPLVLAWVRAGEETRYV